MDQQLPQVILSASFFGRFATLLRDGIQRFQREEGGYLLGRFRDGRLEVEAYFHDQDAESSAGDIKLSTSAFDRAVALGRRQGGLSVIGTWHLHPPGFGAHFSSTDEQSLFIDRMVLNATDPHDYKTPWVHMIVPGVDLNGLMAYTLDISTDMQLNRVGCDMHTEGLLVPPDRRFGLLVRQRSVGKSPFYPMVRRFFSAALRAGRLDGFWRRCPAGPTCLRWERLFVENFIRKVHAADPGADLAGRTFSYIRLVQQIPGRCLTAERYEFTMQATCGREHFVSLPVTLEVIIQNPDTDASQTLTITASTRVADLMRNIQDSEKLPNPPVLWTVLRSMAAEKLRDRTPVDEFGKAYLPEDLRVGEIWAQRETPEVPLYWESPHLSPEIVRRLRTHRFASMGYDLDRLRACHVVIAGLGLLGCGIARILGMLTVGRMTLIDIGCVDWVDVYRQSLYEPRHVGQLKVEAAAAELTAMGSVCKPIHLEIPSVLVPDMQAASFRLHTLAAIVASADIVIGTLDSFSTRTVLQVACRQYGVPFLSASLDYLRDLDLTQGTITLFAGGEGQCYGCGTGKMEDDRGVCTNAPLEFPGIVNSLAAKLVVDALTNPASAAPVSYRIYHDHRIERQPLGPAVESCQVCRLGAPEPSSSAAEWTGRLLKWLIA